MYVLELFAGSRSVGKAAEEHGHTVFSVDWKQYGGIDLITDIEFLSPDDIPFVPDYVHLSPDCTTYTIAAISHHRDGINPKTEYAAKCDKVNKHCIELLKYWLSFNPNMVFTIENPRGMLRKMPFMQEFDRATVWYCKYGDKRAKPTDIWSNNICSIFNTDGWLPRQVCGNNNKHCHHEPAPRGSKTGTQGLSGSYERSVIPEQLCIDWIKAAELKSKNPCKIQTN